MSYPSSAELAASAAASSTTGSAIAPVLTPDDPRFDYFVHRGRNTRFVGRPGTVLAARSAGQVQQAVAQAMRDGKRIAVRGGGHGLENLVDDPAVEVLLDMSELNSVGFDPGNRAFAVDAGAMQGPVYQALYLGWGVGMPAGTCPAVGLGGYVQGAGFGPMCRRHGLIVDHLHAVEVVVADSSRGPRTVVATRDPSDPNHDLWWAHTGAGGGNFGVVTRYWLRSQGAQDANPATLLPTPPRTILTVSANWPWETMTEQAFARIVRNHGEWHRKEAAEGVDRYASLYSGLYLNQRMVGQITLNAQIDGDQPDSEKLLGDYVAAVNEAVGAPCHVRYQAMPWLSSVLRDVENRGVYTRSKSKGAYLRQPYSDEQIATIYRYVADPRYDGHTVVLLFSYGGQINTISPSATAAPQRDSILKNYLGTYWVSPQDDQAHVERLRALYAELFAVTGGVPAPGTATDGSYINYPDVDLTDPELNTSGIPWHTLYFKDGYPRLQRVKARFDPDNIFRHALSVQPAR